MALPLPSAPVPPSPQFPRCSCCFPQQLTPTLSRESLNLKRQPWGEGGQPVYSTRLKRQRTGLGRAGA